METRGSSAIACVADAMFLVGEPCFAGWLIDAAGAGAIVTTAAGFAAAIAAIARVFVNGMTLGGVVDAAGPAHPDRLTFDTDEPERTGVVNDG